MRPRTHSKGPHKRGRGAKGLLPERETNARDGSTQPEAAWIRLPICPPVRQSIVADRWLIGG